MIPVPPAATHNRITGTRAHVPADHIRSTPAAGTAGLYGVRTHAEGCWGERWRCRRLVGRAKMSAMAAWSMDIADAMITCDQHVSRHHYPRLRFRRSPSASDPLAAATAHEPRHRLRKGVCELPAREVPEHKAGRLGPVVMFGAGRTSKLQWTEFHCAYMRSTRQRSHALARHFAAHTTSHDMNTCHRVPGETRPLPPRLRRHSTYSLYFDEPRSIDATNWRRHLPLRTHRPLRSAQVTQVLSRISSSHTYMKVPIKNSNSVSLEMLANCAMTATICWIAAN